MNQTLDHAHLKQWFNLTKRDLPWRHTQDPYAIWISEIMLQQTQVAVVLPYYLRWMTQFPTVQLLAQASLEEIIKAWEGLGYYSRARYLHEGAKYLVNHHQGMIPQTEKELAKIKGLGPYTIGAILSFAFHQKIAAVDGNVLRVLARYFGLEEDIAKPSTWKLFRHLLNELLPDEEPWIINEALIELGATICQRQPKCTQCPLQASCVSYQNGWTQRLPIKSKGPKAEYLYRTVAVIHSQSFYLVKKGEKGKVMSDLYEFPFIEGQEGGLSKEDLKNILIEKFGLTCQVLSAFEEVKHGFTRYSVRLYPFHLICNEKHPIEGYEWIAKDHLIKHPFSSGHRQILKQVLTC